MTLYELAKQVETMRTQQKRYFSTRSKEDLKHSKILEKEVDDNIKKILIGGQQSLSL